MERLKAIIYWKWHMFWYHLIYKQKRIGNYRKQINRFTGQHKVYEVHPLARLGVNFSLNQVNYINQLLGEEQHAKAQELILETIEKELDFSGLAEAFINASKQLSIEENRLEREEIEVWTG
jgi:rRNA maturation protein Rpf1